MRIRRCALVVACTSALAGTLGGVATAEPNNGNTLTYSFTDCTSGSDFQTVKLSQAAGQHLLGSSGIFVTMKAVVLGAQTVNGTFYADGTVLFETPGFSGPNGLPTVTCTNTSPLSGITSRVTGYIAPTR